MMSVKEEEERDVINKSNIVDFDRRITTELLPLMFNPLHKLARNKNNTPRICNQKLNKLNQKPHHKEDIIQSEDKFESLGHMEFVRNLTPEQQKMLSKNPVQNFIPCRAVWNGNSISTSCCLVFDASQPTTYGSFSKGKE